MVDSDGKVVRLIVRGRVQGVGFRQWMVGEAEVRGLRGFVRNRADGTVEAFVAGSHNAVDDLVAACRSGPPGAAVATLEATAPDAATCATVRSCATFAARATRY